MFGHRAAFATIVVLVPTLFAACSPTVEEHAQANEAELSTPRGTELEAFLTSMFAGARLEIAPDAVREPALRRLSARVDSEALTIASGVGETLAVDGAEVMLVTRSNGQASNVAFKSLASADGRTTVGIVDVDDPGGGRRTLIEREVIQGDPRRPESLVATLFEIDAAGDAVLASRQISKASDLSSADSSVLHAQALSTLTNGSFASPKLCGACKSTIRALKFGGIASSWLAAHHFHTAVCAGTGVAAGALAVETGPGAVAAGAAGYRGCRIVMATAASILALSVTLPSEEEGRVSLCNWIADMLPGTSAWCVPSAPPSCGLTVIDAAKDAAAQCQAVALCARDSKCPDAVALCGGLLLSKAVDPDPIGHCKQIAGVACSPNIQSEGDVAVACKRVLAGEAAVP